MLIGVKMFLEDLSLRAWRRFQGLIQKETAELASEETCICATASWKWLSDAFLLPSQDSCPSLLAYISLIRILAKMLTNKTLGYGL